ncbi:LOW QUALITY PROTEIN: taste receptor type 2 member 9-like [Cariama cristata]
MEACYSQDKFNATTCDATSTVIVTIQAFTGMWINAFIVSVLGIAWVKKKSFNSNEKILLFLGCCRFWYFCNTWVYFFLSMFYPWCLYVYPIPQLFATIQSFLNASNVWVSACLCVFCCIKIANFRHTFFFYLKVKIDRIVPWLLLGSVFLPLVMCILVYNITEKMYYNNLNSTTLGNFWKSENGLIFFPFFFINGFGFATAFTAVIFSALLLLFSVYHKHKMQTNSVKNLSMDAHIKAMKSVLSFFFTCSINFTCLILALIYTTKEENPMLFLISVFQDAFLAVHSLILIFSNPKLEKTLLKTLRCVKCKV